MRPPLFATLFVATSLSLTGCPDDKKVPLGGTCGGDSECAQGQCIANLCLDPDGDEDGDGLTNRLEATLGTNPLLADSDGDGIPDGDEVGSISNPTDTDGDGKIDAIESATADADSDCIPDQLDPDDANPETDPAVLGQALCSKVGVCGVEGAVVTASCPADLVPVCDYSQAPQYEAVETSCDGVDNDCDGETDENQAAGGSVTFDGGGFAGDAGKVLGDACGMGACAGGTVVCAVDMASLVCTTSNNVGALTCGADNNCNGAVDLSEVADPLTTELAGCTDHYVDGDGDTFGAGEAKCLCGPTGTYAVTVAGDCNDDDGTRFPGNTVPICGVDADCDDSLVDVGEPCDDGNEAIDDGCAMCSVIGRVIGGVGANAGYAKVTNLPAGGFVVAWHEGFDPSSERWLGRALAFYDGEGREVLRHAGIEVENQGSERSALAALRGGGVVYGAWVLEGRSWYYRVQRYTDAGVAEGAPIDVHGPAQETWEFGLVATGTGAFAAWWSDVDAVGAYRIALRHVDAVGRPATDIGGHSFLGQYGPYQIDAVGLPSGEVVLSWLETNELDFSSVSLLQRFGADGQAAADAFGGLPATFVGTIRSTRLVGLADGYALFFLEDRFIEQTNTGVSPVGYATFDGSDARVGDLTYIQEGDDEGCPYQFAGGFDEAGHAFGLLEDAECRSPVRGALRVGETAIDIPFGGLDLTARYSQDLGSSKDGPLTVAFMVLDERTNLGGLYLYRFAAGATPSYIPGPPPIER